MDESRSPAWLTIVGVGEDGMAGLAEASRTALAGAEFVFGAPRHLGLVPAVASPDAERIEWPVPFADGIERLLALRGRRVVMLASGDPFCLGGGSVVARHLAVGEWTALPAPSVFSLAAARLGWPLERTVCVGLHAAPLGRLRAQLAPRLRMLVTLRDGAAVASLAHWLVAQGFGASTLHVLEALGGVRERTRTTLAAGYAFADVAHPVVVGIEAAAEAHAVVPRACGLPDGLFEHDGQITKRPMRALTLSALAPRPGEHLWDIGTGSGSIAIEWLLAHPANAATAFEADPRRAQRARSNACALGVDCLQVIEGRAPAMLDGQPLPDAVFVGGGLSAALLEALWARLRPGTRVVCNAVTLESEALLAQWQAVHGGTLLRIELAEAAALGSRRGWKSAYPVVQWSTCR